MFDTFATDLGPKGAKMLRTPLCSLLDIELPIIQAPIGSATSPALAAAVSNAGGLGMLALSWHQTDEVRRMVQETGKLTHRPFGANLALAWAQEARLAACLEEGVRVVSFFWGDPGPYIDRAHDAGATVLHTVGDAAEARRAVDAGVDVIVAQGWEAGGHVWGEVATFPLIPAVVDAVAPKPVVAAGGIGDGRGVAAALALGAGGVWVGTRFLASEEAAVDAIYKDLVVESRETDTLYSRLFDVGWPDAPHRTLRNSTVELWEAAGRPGPGSRPGEGETVATFADGRPAVRYSDVIPLAGMTGDLEALALYAGQSVGLVGEIQPASEIVDSLMNEASTALTRLNELSLGNH
jgi:nitronate monooxygenase